MKQQVEIFDKYLDFFEKSVLAANGYISNERSIWRNPRTYSYTFLSPQLGLKMSINLGDLIDGRYLIQVSMQSEQVGVHQQRKYFTIQNYIRDHGLTDFRSISEPGEDFELFTKHFFENLQTACETYLRDQITGVSFEEHDPWMGR